MAQQKNKRSMDDLEDSDRDRKRKRSSKESISTAQFAQRPAAEDSHDSIFPVTSNSPRVDTASTLTHDQDPIPTANAGHTSRIAIPSKRSCPFGKDVPRKRRKKENYVIVRAYKQRKDLEHTDEVECALTPDGDLDLVSVSRKLNVRECQASRFNAIPFCGPCSLLLGSKVLDARSSRPWFSRRPILKSRAIRLLKAKEGYLRVVGQSFSSLVSDQGV